MKWHMIAAATVAGVLLSGIGGTALAASSPAAGEPPLVAWIWSNSADEVAFDYSGNSIPFPFPAVSAATSAHWGGLDNPAPLLWYAQHVDHNNLATMVKDVGQMFAGKYSAALMTKMKAEHFNPMMVGGIGFPPVSHSDPTSSQPTKPPTHSITPSKPVKAPVSHTVAPKPTHSTAPKSSKPFTVTTPQPVTPIPKTAAHSTAPHSTQSAAPVSTPTPGPSAPVQPSNQAGVSYAQYRHHLTAESAPKHHSGSTPGQRPWIWGIVAASVVGGGGVGLWRWRQGH